MTSEQRDDVAMMGNENRWPAWPYLPLRNSVKSRPDGLADIGCLFSGQGPKLFLANMFAGIKDDTPTKQYESYEEIVADGWYVD